MYPPTLHICGWRYRGPRRELQVAGVPYRILGCLRTYNVYVFARPWAYPILKAWQWIDWKLVPKLLWPLALARWKACKKWPQLRLADPGYMTRWQLLTQWKRRDG